MINPSRIRAFVLALIISSGYSSPICADSVYNAHVNAELISDISTIMPSQSFWIGLQMTMDKGWHTYWRNSGDSGLSTDIQWYLPKGFDAGEIQWSYPKRFDYSQGLAGYGYDGEVILLTEIFTPEEFPLSEEFQINAKVNWLSCEKICVPGIAYLSISFDANNEEAPISERNHQLIMEEKQRWPTLTDTWQVTAFNKDDTYLLNISPNIAISYDMMDLAFFPYRNDIIDHSAKQAFRQVQGGYQLIIPKTVLLEKKIQKIQGVLVSSQGWNNEGKEKALYFDAVVNE